MALLSPGWRRLRFDLVSYAGLAPFLAFALFPFYWMVITSFKADANLYDLRRNPFWFSNVDGRTGQPYHKDIIIPASYNAGTIRWMIVPGAHTARSDSEEHPAPIAFVCDRPIVSPVDATRSEIQVPSGQMAQP